METSEEGHQYSSTFIIQHERPLSASSAYTVVNNENHIGLVENCVQTRPTTSVNLSEVKTIIFLSICLPRFEDREVKNLKWV